MKVKTAVTSLKVEKGCVNMDCKYCTEKGKCNLGTILTLLKQIFKICEENEGDCIGECGNYNTATRILEILSDQKESEER